MTFPRFSDDTAAYTDAMTVNHGKIGDTERDRAVEALGVHFAQGRLQLDEYERRTDQALYAETLDELDQVFIDLPLPRYDSVMEPYRRAQAPTSVPTTSNHTWTRTTTPPSGKTRIWKRPYGMSKIQAISVGWLLTAVLIMLYGIGFVTVVAMTGSETAAIIGLFSTAGLTVITVAVMVINTILIATSYDPDAHPDDVKGDHDYPY